MLASNSTTTTPTSSAPNAHTTAVNPNLNSACSFMVLSPAISGGPNAVIGGNVGATSGTQTGVATDDILGFGLTLDPSGNFSKSISHSVSGSSY